MCAAFRLVVTGGILLKNNRGSQPGGLTDFRASKVQLLWEGSTCGAAQVNPPHRGLLLVSWQTCAVLWLVDIGAALLRRRYRLYEHSAYLGGRYDAKWAAFIYPRHSFPGSTHGKLELANIRGHKLWCWFISRASVLYKFMGWGAKGAGGLLLKSSSSSSLGVDDNLRRGKSMLSI